MIGGGQDLCLFIWWNPPVCSLSLPLNEQTRRQHIYTCMYIKHTSAHIYIETVHVRINYFPLNASALHTTKPSFASDPLVKVMQLHIVILTLSSNGQLYNISLKNIFLLHRGVTYLK